MTEREDTIERIERVLKLTHKESITVTIPRLTAERAVSMLKEQEPIKPYLDYDGRDVWRCGKCGNSLFHPSYYESDKDAKNHIRYCNHCGQVVKWE